MRIDRAVGNVPVVEQSGKKTDKREAIKMKRRQDKQIAIRARAERLAAMERAAKERKGKKAEAKRLRAAEQKKIREVKAKRAAERAEKRKKVYVALKSKFKNGSAGFGYKNSGVVSRVVLAVKGDITSVVAAIASSGADVRDIAAVGGETLVKIQKKDLRKVIAILDGMCYTHRVNATLGMWHRCAFVLSRFGLVVGAIAAAMGLYISYGYIWRIEIDGNTYLSAAAIETALYRAGVFVGCKKSEPIANRVAAALGDLDGISDAACEIRGTTLYVRVLESKGYVVRRVFKSAISDYDAVVTRVVVRSGNALVKRGDIVKIGDVLADGNVFSTTGEPLYTEACDVDVYGNVSITFVAQISRTAVEYRRTGRMQRRTVFELFGKTIGKFESPYPSYQMRSCTANYDVFIPLYATTYEYYETAAVEYERDMDKAAKQFASSKIEELEFVGNFDCDYNILQSQSDMYTMHLFLSGEALISRGVPLE